MMRFKITLPEELKPGDWVCVDRATGRLVKASPSDAPVFTVPLGAYVDVPTGTLCWPVTAGSLVPHIPPKLDVRPAFTGAGAPSFRPARHGKRAAGK